MDKNRQAEELKWHPLTLRKTEVWTQEGDKYDDWLSKSRTGKSFGQLSENPFRKNSPDPSNKTGIRFYYKLPIN